MIERCGFDTPIYILNFNQVSILRRLVDWLQQAGYRSITILDNHSSYPPLLEYYDELHTAEAVQVVFRRSNDHKRDVWDQHLAPLNHPFVLTTSDVVPDDDCPTNVVAKLAHHLMKNPDLHKAGLGLRIDDIPFCYGHRDQVLTKQGEYWTVPALGDAFLAPIDFTFSLYRRGGDFRYAPAIRTCWPYLARHLPWYADSANPTAEERYYAETIEPGRGSWGRQRLPDWLLKRCDEIAAQPTWTRVNLACSRNRLPGWINVDANPDVQAEIIFDINGCAYDPLPLDDQSVDGILIGPSFAAVETWKALLVEMRRVARQGALLVIRLDPSESSSIALTQWPCLWRDPAGTFGINRLGWMPERVMIVVQPSAGPMDEDEALDHLGRGSDIVREVVVHLRAIAGESDAPRTTTVNVTTSPLDPHALFGSRPGWLSADP